MSNYLSRLSWITHSYQRVEYSTQVFKSFSLPMYRSLPELIDVSQPNYGLQKKKEIVDY